jgi:hypothetical protein
LLLSRRNAGPSPAAPQSSGRRTEDTRLAPLQGAVERLVGSVGGGAARWFASRSGRWGGGGRIQGERNITDISPQYLDVLMGNSYFGPQGPKRAFPGGVGTTRR